MGASTSSLPPRAERVVVVTGAGAGMGLALTQRLDRAGYVVVATARADAALDELRRVLSARAVVRRLDVTSEKDAAALAQDLAERFPRGVYALVNNAGVVATGQIEWLGIDTYRRQMETNYFGAVIMTKALIKSVRIARGRIVNVSSISGALAGVDYGSYAPTKFALNGFSDALRREMRPFGVQVIVVVPGLINTAMVDEPVLAERERVYGALPEDVRAAYGDDFVRVSRQRLQDLFRGSLSVDDAVEVIFHAVDARRPRPYVYVGLVTFVQCLAAYVLPPAVFDFALSFLMGGPVAGTPPAPARVKAD